MKFDSKDIDVSIEELGCTITFCDRKEEYPERITTAQGAIDSKEQYVLIQRTYPEDEFETDYYYIEFSEFDDSGEFDDFKMVLTPSQLEIEYEKSLFR